MTKNSLILCIETTTEVCSVSLSLQGEKIQEISISEPNAHGSQLTLLIQQIIEQEGYRLSDLSAVAYSSGPGSYTGLRIGLSVAKGICFGNEIPLIEVPTLTHMAHQAIQLDPTFDGYFPMLDARRMEVYGALLNKDLTVQLAPFACLLEEYAWENLTSIGKIAYFGNGAMKAAKVVANHPHLHYLETYQLSAASMCMMAHQRFIHNDFVDLALHVPFYLKGAHITESKKKTF